MNEAQTVEAERETGDKDANLTQFVFNTLSQPARSRSSQRWLFESRPSIFITKHCFANQHRNISQLRRPGRGRCSCSRQREEGKRNMKTNLTRRHKLLRNSFANNFSFFSKAIVRNLLSQTHSHLSPRDHKPVMKSFKSFFFSVKQTTLILFAFVPSRAV